MANNDFPRLLYKKSVGGNSHDIWGLGTFETLRAVDQAAVEAALAEGWTLRPDDKPAPAKTAKAAQANA